MNRNLTILVAEDNQNEAALLKYALKKANINNPLQIVETGRDAIDYLNGDGRFGDRSKFPFPSVIMLDLKMPGLSGFDVLAWLREHPKHAVIPTIVLTNSRLAEDIRQAYRLGANSYIVKPNDVAELVRVLRAAHEYWGCCEKPDCFDCRET